QVLEPLARATAIGPGDALRERRQRGGEVDRRGQVLLPALAIGEGGGHDKTVDRPPRTRKLPPEDEVCLRTPSDLHHRCSPRRALRLELQFPGRREVLTRKNGFCRS